MRCSFFKTVKAIFYFCITSEKQNTMTSYNVFPYNIEMVTHGEITTNNFENTTIIVNINVFFLMSFMKVIGRMERDDSTESMRKCGSGLISEGGRAGVHRSVHKPEWGKSEFKTIVSQGLLLALFL